VGMDVVKTVIESLRGILLIESVPGRGSTFTLKLPLTLAVVAVLLVMYRHRGNIARLFRGAERKVVGE